jgi:hypothetical protein
MVTSQKKRLSSPHDNAKSFMMFVGAALLIGFFLFGLHWGGKSEGKKTSVTAGELHHREEVIRQNLKDCNEAESSIIGKSQVLEDTASEIKDRNKKLDERNKELYHEHSEQETAIAKCQEETESQMAIFTEKDEELKRQIANLKEENEHLEQALQDLTGGHGMRTVLLHASMVRTQERYQRLVKLIDDTEHSIQTADALMEKYANQLNKADALSEQMRLQVERSIANWTHWRYNASADNDIFLQTVDEDGEVIRPAALGRVGTPPVKVVKRLMGRGLNPASSLAERMVETYDIATCAMRLNSPNFTFPNGYYWHYHLEADKSFMSNIVDTPLVQFCNGCFNRRKSKEFQIACEEELASAVYGGHDFWAARSRIRFYPAVEHEADNFIFANDLKGKKYLAVVLHSSADTYQKCEEKVGRSPAPHYLYIRGNFNEQVKPSTEDPVLQCAPNWDQIVARIKEITSEEGAAYDAVYLSIEPESMERVHYEDLTGTHIVMMEQKNAFDEAVDMVVASRASKILVSPYLAQSQVVTELFLLRNQLDPNHNVVFF